MKRPLIDVLTRLQASAQPNDDEAMDAVVPAAMWREFVDAHAQALYDHAHPPEVGAPQGWRDVLAQVRLGLAAGSRSISNSDYEIEYGGAMLDKIEELMEALPSPRGTPAS